jgi:hypothetical protein
MGALLVDAVLQSSGLDYKHTVKPRVERVQREHQEAVTTSLFAEAFQREGDDILNWGGRRKHDLMTDLIAFFQKEGVETVEQLRAWIAIPRNKYDLLNIQYVGDKTADYFVVVVGAPSGLAVDIWLYRFLEDAGVSVVMNTPGRGKS